MIYREQFGVDLPADPIEARRAAVETREPEPFDIALMRSADGWHVAVYLGRNRIIHTAKGKNACIERLDWRRPRYFRYQGAGGQVSVLD